ncbi:hypothetical protein BC941DRAFT_470808 [Chlamydoabsidia padenii]|nr:hypothetical protein BC941DRAFT_470808 [Chlamydoabsidia padenii]
MSKQVTPPSQAYTRQQAYDSDTHSLDSNTWSPTYIPSATTLITSDEKTSSVMRSQWLQQRQKNSKRDRAVLGCVGLIVLVVLVGTIILWVASAFILPQNKYSTTLAHVPRSSFYQFDHHPSTTMQSSNPTATL